jgi:hypothetical protein
MASKKLKRAGKVAAAIGAAYLASQALGKKKPTTAEAKGLKITRAKKFGESDEGQMARLDAAQQRGLDITRSKPFEASDDASPATYQNVPASKFLTTPGGMGNVSVEQADEMMQGFGPMAKKGKFIVKKAKECLKKNKRQNLKQMLKRSFFKKRIQRNFYRRFLCSRWICSCKRKQISKK